MMDARPEFGADRLERFRAALFIKLNNEGLNRPAHIPAVCLHFSYNNNHQCSFKLNCSHCGGCHGDIFRLAHTADKLSVNQSAPYFPWIFS